MKKLILVLTAIVAFALPLSAQSPTGSITAAATTCRPTNCVRFTLPTSGDTGAVAVQLTGTFTATVQFEASANPADETSYVAISGIPVGSSTASTSATAAGMWQFSTSGILAIQARASAYTSGTASVYMQRSDQVPVAASIGGSTGPINITQIAGQTTATNGNGVIAVAGAASSGLIVATASCSGSTCYTSPVNAGATVITSGSTSTLFATTTSIVSGHCNNSTAAAVTLTATDGNNVPFIGTTTHGASYSIAAVTSFSFPSGLIGAIMTDGIRMSASAANAITCWVKGLQ